MKDAILVDISKTGVHNLFAIAVRITFIL